MITNAHVYAREQSIAVLQNPPLIPRGDPTRRIGATDLIEFGRSPYRWVWGEDPEDALAATGPCLCEWLAFDVGNAERYYIRRPETYESIKLECPKCHSEGPAKICTKCGQRRKNVVKPRPWSAAAKVCQAWTEKAAAAKRQPIPGPEWDRAQMGADAILADKALLGVIRNSSHLRTLHGVWRDEATGLDIPLWARATLVPNEDSAATPALVQLVETRNADPTYWEGYAYGTGQHIRAALLMALWNKLGFADVREHLWVVIERDPPRLLGRRRAARELLEEGRKRLAELLHCYALCLQSGKWPRFEDDELTGLDAWTMVSLQPWMSTGAGPHGGYFAPTALPAAPAPLPAYEEAA